MLTAIYAVLHFLVDLTCAFSMFTAFRNSVHWYEYLLVYNFCAFALQMPFGILLDFLHFTGKYRGIKKYLNAAAASLGIILVAAGFFIHPLILGIGNALFHVGGGIDVIREDQNSGLKGRALGIFVAPGAVGLYLGTCLGKENPVQKEILLILIVAVMVILAAVLIKRLLEAEASDVSSDSEISDTDGDSEVIGKGRRSRLAGAVCLIFLAVLLRSYAGFYTEMPWKTGFLAGLVAATSAAAGKMVGGFAAARYGIAKTAAVSLVIASIGFLFSDHMFTGALAILLFNMTMPVTLYLITEEMKAFPGFSFGLLTLALFIGYLPCWFQRPQIFSGKLTGMLASLVTAGILLITLKILREEKV